LGIFSAVNESTNGGTDENDGCDGGDLGGAVWSFNLLAGSVCRNAQSGAGGEGDRSRGSLSATTLVALSAFAPSCTLGSFTFATCATHEEHTQSMLADDLKGASKKRISPLNSDDKMSFIKSVPF
jgi:hypothetical protein